MTDVSLERRFVGMIIVGPVFIKAKPGKKKTVIVDFLEDCFVVDVAAKAEDNDANEELMRYLSKVSKRQVKIKSGFTSKNKIVILK